MISRHQVLSEARSWIGTPYHHQQSIKGVGVDCVGLVRGVCANLGMCPNDMTQLEGATPYLGYSRSPDGRKLAAAFEQFTTPIEIEDAQPGDIFMLRWRTFPQHVGFFANYQHGGFSIIHALGMSDGRGRVTEHRLDERTMKKITAAYRLPGVA